MRDQAEQRPAVAETPSPAVAAAPWPWRLALAGLFLFVFAVVALSGPGRMDIVDGQTRYEVARSLVEHGDSVIRDPNCWFAIVPGRDGSKYTNYRLPQSALGVLAIVAADATGPTCEPRRHFFFGLISPGCAALLAVIYAAWFRALGLGPGASLAWAAAGIFCTPNWYYATSVFDEMLTTTAIVLAVALAFLTRDRRPVLGALAAGLALGWAFNCKQPAAVFVLPALAAAYDPSVPLRRQLGRAGLILGGLALGAVAYKLYDLAKYPPGSYDPAAVELQYGAVWADSPLPGLMNLTVSPAAGAVWYCPTLLLTFLGLRRWLAERRLYCAAVLAATVILLGFVSLLDFYKGDPTWGPRYLTPAFALLWLFVPAGAARLSRVLTGTLLVAGLAVQLLALSVDPIRLYLEAAIPMNPLIDNPQAAFHLPYSHLLQRPREIRDLLAAGPERRARWYNTPAGVTHSGRLPPPYPTSVAASVGLLAMPVPSNQASSAFGFGMAPYVLWKAQSENTARDFHIYASFRPWWLSQQYLSPAERPVDLPRTAALLLALAALGLGLAAAGRSLEGPPHERRRTAAAGV